MQRGNSEELFATGCAPEYLRARRDVAKVSHQGQIAALIAIAPFFIVPLSKCAF